MSLAYPKPVLRITFGIRLLLFLAAPTALMYVTPAVVALSIISGILFTWVVDLLTGGTIWIAAHRGTIAAQIVFLILVAIYMGIKNEFTISSVLTILILLLALSSDAITNSLRWKVLLPVGVIAAAIVNFVHTDELFRWGAGAYPVIPFLAALARLVFPRTKNLIHTSLDYPPVRLEILSMGMKRVAAIGIKIARL